VLKNNGDFKFENILLTVFKRHLADEFKKLIIFCFFHVRPKMSSRTVTKPLQKKGTAATTITITFTAR
jgi:uncharacterized membrane protein YciS (DUF1049 family)